MSHTSVVKAIVIQSIAALNAAIAELNKSGVKCTLTPNATPRAYYSGQSGMGKADYVIGLTGSRYDIGLYKTDDGYEARTDFWGGDVEKLLGAPASKPENKEQARMGKLFQLYGVHAAMEQARKKGLQARRQKGADGREQVVVTGYR